MQQLPLTDRFGALLTLAKPLCWFRAVTNKVTVEVLGTESLAHY